MASIVVEDRRQGRARERLETLARGRLQEQGVRTKLAIADDGPASTELDHDVECLARGHERGCVVGRAVARAAHRDGRRPRTGHCLDRDLQIVGEAARALSPAF